MTWIIWIIWILLIFLLVFNIILYPHVYEYGAVGHQLKPTICFIGGVHGNEPAGTMALMELIDNNFFESYVDQYHIIVIPDVNRFGLFFGTRYTNNLFGPDINRSFGDDHDPITTFILNKIQNSYLVIDFHEGYDFHIMNPASMGSTITHVGLDNLAYQIIKNINMHIKDKNKKFSIISNDNIGGTLLNYMNKSKRNYILVETSGQNDIQPLNVRVTQIKWIVSDVFDYLSNPYQ